MADSVASGVRLESILTAQPDGTFVLPAPALVALFATREPAELDRLMDRMFGSERDDVLLSSLVTLSNSLAHALERMRRRRGLRAIKLRCTTCKA